MSELSFTDEEYAAVCDHALTLLRRPPNTELQMSIITDVNLIEQLCRQSLINEMNLDEPVVVFIPRKVRRECVIAVWWFLRRIGYDVRIEDKLGPNGEARLKFGFYLTDVVTQDAFKNSEIVN